MADVPIGRLLALMARRPMYQAFQADFRRKFDTALRKGLVGAAGQVREFATNLQDEQFGNPGDAQAEFNEVAAAMRSALITGYGDIPGYEGTVEARKVVASYRIGEDRYSGGALRRALEDPSQAVADPNGVSFLNRTLLDIEARHWRRLNYGAGVGSNHNLHRPVRFDERILFYAGSEAGPRPSFTLPPGRFIDPRTGLRVPYGKDAAGEPLSLPPTVDRFFPGGGGRGAVQTRGIQPRHYIDAGFAALADRFPIALRSLYVKWSRQALGSFHPTPTNVRA